jgi:hypothetical protein
MAIYGNQPLFGMIHARFVLIVAVELVVTGTMEFYDFPWECHHPN